MNQLFLVQAGKIIVSTIIIGAETQNAKSLFGDVGQSRLYFDRKN
jgi:hypothetical protein